MSTASDLTYLDNNATTCVDPAVVEEMLPWLTKNYGNPSSGYRFGKRVNDALELARERVAALEARGDEGIELPLLGTVTADGDR